MFLYFLFLYSIYFHIFMFSCFGAFEEGLGGGPSGPAKRCDASWVSTIILAVGYRAHNALRHATQQPLQVPRLLAASVANLQTVSVR